MTQDVDIFIKPTVLNAKRTPKAVRAIGYDIPQNVLSETVLTSKILLRQYILQTDIRPFVAGTDVENAWKDRIETTIEGLLAYVPSLEMMINMKEAAGREKDKSDLRVLKRIQRKQESPSKGKR